MYIDTDGSKVSGKVFKKSQKQFNPLISDMYTHHLHTKTQDHSLSKTFINMIVHRNRKKGLT